MDGRLAILGAPASPPAGAAEGKLAGTYDYLTNAGKSERQAVTFQATFRRDAGGWKLASVR